MPIRIQPYKKENAMKDETFAQALESLNQKAIEQFTEEVLRCWLAIQRGSCITDVTAQIENQYMRETVAHMLAYILLQLCLYNAERHKLITSKRHEELKTYLDQMMKSTRLQPLMFLPFETA